jgi:hypothetical protein
VDLLNGIELVKSNLFTKGTRQNKTHKSKRINKKWRKKYGFVDIPDKQVYMMQGKIFGHPITIDKIIKGARGI